MDVQRNRHAADYSPFPLGAGNPLSECCSTFLNEVLTDTTDWIALNTTYVPDSAYQFITIGNFLEDSLSAPTVIDTSVGFNFAYAFVDDVRISLDPNGFNGSQVTHGEAYGGWWATTPFVERLDVVFDAPDQQAFLVSLLDTDGRLVSSKTLEGWQQRLQWDLTGISKGLYLLVALGRSKLLSPIRVVKVSP
jgi:hypothetical protein